MVKRTFWKRTFGRKFGKYDLILLAIIFGYPVYLYLNATEGIVLVNEGFNAIFEVVGGWIFGVTLLGYFGNFIIKRAKR